MSDLDLQLAHLYVLADQATAAEDLKALADIQTKIHEIEDAVRA